MSQQKRFTYERLLDELANKNLSKLTIPRLVEKCSQVIDDLGCEILHQYEDNLSFTSGMLNLKRQQKKIIRIRDILFEAYNDAKDLTTRTRKMDYDAMEGIGSYHDE